MEIMSMRRISPIYKPISVGLFSFHVNIILMLFIASKIYAGRPPECSWSIESSSVTAGRGESLRVICHIRTLVPSYLLEDELNSTLTALKHSTNTISLTLVCARQVVFESEIIPGMFSSFGRLEDLSLINCKIIKFPAHAMIGLPNLRRLVVHSHHEDWPGRSLFIENYALSDLTNVEVLDLSFNNIWNIPKDTLCFLSSLLTLNLTFNGLHQILDLELNSKETCTHPLLQLFLDNNEITEIPENALISTENLRFLSLSNNYIARLSDKSFSGLSKLRFLDLSHNRLVAIPSLCFNGLNELEELNLFNNSISSLPPKLFTDLSHLLSLNLSFNQLDFSPDKTAPFSGLIRLVILDLSKNQISFLEPDTFATLYSLQVLNLQHNFISILPDNAFQGLSNVHTLLISFNNISKISEKVFIGLPVLSELELDHNKISSMHINSMEKCSSIRGIKLSNNHFNNVPNAITKVKLLKRLDLRNNNITSIISKSFTGLGHLKELILSHNLITTIHPEAFINLPKLTVFNLAFNNITSMPNTTLSDMKNLEDINLSHNKFKSLYGLAESLQNVLFINASHNKIEWFDYAVLPQSLKKIDISYNLVEKLGNHYKLDNHLNLRELHSGNNKITQINSLSIINTLEEVYLQENMIDYVAPNTFADKINISLINLEGNNLNILGEPSVRIRSKFNSEIISYPKLYLAGNPLECNCDAEWLMRALSLDQASTTHIKLNLPLLGRISTVKCKLPGLWDNIVVPVVSVKQEQFLCTYRRHCFPVCHCCEFDACDCEQTCPKNCSCYHDQTWSQNIVDCGNGNWSEVPSGVPMDVTEAYLDGNIIRRLTSHMLIGKKNLKRLHLNNSEITSIQNQTFNGLRGLLILRLNDNLLEILNGYEFIDLDSLIELSLHNNLISYINNNTFSHLRALEKLELQQNRISTFPVWNLAMNPFLVEVSLYNNLWSCECSYLANLRAWLEANRIKTMNASYITCFHNITQQQGPSLLSNTPIMCDHYRATHRIGDLIVNDYIMLLAISLIILVLIVCGALITIAYRKRLKLWMFSRYSKPVFEPHTYLEDKQKLFDVFISHSAKDTTWVCGLLAPELEARGYNVCVAHRDCIVNSGSLTSQAVCESIACSRRLVLVISKSFVDSEWCKYDFKSAHLEGIQNIKKNNIIIIKIDDLPKCEYDGELAKVIRTAGHNLLPKEVKFWEQLEKSLPSLNRKKCCPELNNFSRSRSKPLIESNHEANCLLNKNNCRSLGNVTSHSFAINPYWETAMTADFKDVRWAGQNVAFNNKTWLPQTRFDHHLQTLNTIKNEDHTYMSMSDCDDVLHSGDTSSSLTGATASLNDSRSPQEAKPKSPKEKLPSNISSFKIESPDYIARSWIFHPKSADQRKNSKDHTYFV